jgi:hypothetical protein
MGGGLYDTHRMRAYLTAEDGAGTKKRGSQHNDMFVPSANGAAEGEVNFSVCMVQCHLNQTLLFT